MIPSYYRIPNISGIPDSNADLRSRPFQIHEVVAYSIERIDGWDETTTEDDPFDEAFICLYREKGKLCLGFVHYPHGSDKPAVTLRAAHEGTGYAHKSLAAFKRDLTAFGLHYHLSEDLTPVAQPDRLKSFVSPATQKWTVREVGQGATTWYINTPWGRFAKLLTHSK